MTDTINDTRIPLGRFGGPTPDERPGAILRLGHDQHHMTVGKTGSGKTVCMGIPSALSDEECSFFTVDFKGTTALTTARYRSTFSDVYIIDPHDVTGLGNSGFDPISNFRSNSDFLIDDALALADAMIPHDEGREPFWPEGAQHMTTGVTIGEVSDAEREERTPSFLRVLETLCEGEDFELLPEGRKRLSKGARYQMARMCVQGPPETRFFLDRMLKDNNETSGIRSHAINKLAWAATRRLSRSLSSNGVDFSQMKRRPMSVYVVCPVNRVSQSRGWLRMIVSSVMQHLYEPGGLRVRLVLDELPLLRKLDCVVDAFALSREAGVQIMAMIQSIGQLRRSFGEEAAEIILANCGVIQAFAANDVKTAAWMSEMSGDTTVVAAGYNVGDSQNSSGPGHSNGLTYGQIRRPVVLPSEARDLPYGRGLMWTAGSSKTIPFDAVPYWDDPVLKARADPNPFHEQRGKPLGDRR